MLQVSSAIGLDRLGDWQRSKVFTPRGRYERRDAMAGTGRLADWIECSCLFGRDPTVAKADVIDELVDSGVLHPTRTQTSEEVAEFIVDETFVELRRRAQLMLGAGAYSFPFAVEPSIVRRTIASWADETLYAFLLLASMGQLARWIRVEGTTDDIVGHLFEELVRHAAEGLFGQPSIIVKTSSRGADHLKDRMRAVLLPFDREVTDEIVAAPARVRDGGLDVVIRLWDESNDVRPARAHFLVQCASGNDWEQKLGHPVIAKWREWVRWRGPVYKVFAVPFVFADDDRLHDASRDADWALVLDRSRLLYGLRRAGPISKVLGARVEQWCTSRLRLLKREGLAL